MSKKKKVHVIVHTHWDREWYFTISRSTVYLIKHIKEVLNILEADFTYRYYLLDAQTSLLTDYLRYCPEDRKRIENLVKQRRLLTGPWYTQTDQLVISQESVVRNLYYGTTEAENFGHCMRIGYVPDAFGQGGNMPQIYRGFAIENVLFWRGLSDTRGKYTEFNWQGDDGTTVFAVQIPLGYCTSGFIPEDDAQGQKYWNEQLKVIEERASTRHLYASWGFDQAPVRRNIPRLLQKANLYDSEREYVLASPESFFAEIKEEAPFSEIRTIKGELTEGKHSRIHKSIFSTRADLKQANNEIENYLVNTLEPILVMSHHFGNRYPHKEVEEIWKLLLQNAAHDSIGGCNSDSTNEDIKQRYKLARDKSASLVELNTRLITQRIPQKSPIMFTLFNPLTYGINKTVTFSAYVPSHEFSLVDEAGEKIPYTISASEDLTSYVQEQVTQLNKVDDIYIPEKIYKVMIKATVKNMPAFGYKTFKLLEEASLEYSKEQILEEAVIENDCYQVVLENNNCLTITCKKTGKIYSDQLLFEENGDDGDSYNYSPPRKDLLTTSQEAKLIYKKIICSKVEQRLIFKLNMAVPKNLTSRSLGKRDGELNLTVEVTLQNLAETILFKVTADNKTLSHRLCVLFDSSIASQFSTADQLFGNACRPVYRKEMAVWEKEKWQETPICIEPMQSYVSLHNKNGGCALITEGVREYEIVGKKYSVIRLTLFRTFGYMGKADLLYRPDRASGDSIVKTPTAQLLGEIQASFSFYDFSKHSFDQANVARMAKELLTTYPVYETADFLNNRMSFVYRKEAKDLLPHFSLLNLSEMTAVVSTVKKAEASDDLIVRIFNPYISTNATIAPSLLASGKQVLLDEKTPDVSEKSELSTCEFLTFRLSN